MKVKLSINQTVKLNLFTQLLSLGCYRGKVEILTNLLNSGNCTQVIAQKGTW